MKETCVISFGDSATYRISDIAAEGVELPKIEKEVKVFLKEKFPQLTALPYYSKMTVRKMKLEDALKYPEFSSNALDNIKKTLAAEIADARSIAELNLDAPYSDIN
ncbi:MAG: hypothetical protein K2G67_04975 [Muribaculaceae bacterium]|nr:hypothetical protein [Muribaculaceae bacterium]